MGMFVYSAVFFEFPVTISGQIIDQAFHRTFPSDGPWGLPKSSGKTVSPGCHTWYIPYCVLSRFPTYLFGIPLNHSFLWDFPLSSIQLWGYHWYHHLWKPPFMMWNSMGCWPPPCFSSPTLPRRPEELVPGRFRFAIAQFEDAFQQLQDPLPPIFNQHLAPSIF